MAMSGQPIWVTFVDISAHLPKYAIGADAQILKNKPNSELVILVVESEGACAQRPNQISSEHARRLVRGAQRLLLVRLLMPNIRPSTQNEGELSVPNMLGGWGRSVVTYERIVHLIDHYWVRSCCDCSHTGTDYIGCSSAAGWHNLAVRV